MLEESDPSRSCYRYPWNGIGMDYRTASAPPSSLPKISFPRSPASELVQGKSDIRPCLRKRYRPSQKPQDSHARNKTRLSTPFVVGSSGDYQTRTAHERKTRSRELISQETAR